MAMQALKLAQSKGEFVFSEETRQELLTVLRRPKFDKYMDLQMRIDEANGILYKAKFVTIKKTGHEIICRDEADIKFLMVALEVNADCIVSGDMHLKELHPFRNIPILGASDFVTWITLKGS